MAKKSKKHTKLKISDVYLRVFIDLIVGDKLNRLSKYNPEAANHGARLMLKEGKELVTKYGVHEDTFNEFAAEFTAVCLQLMSEVLARVLYETGKHGIKEKSNLIVPKGTIIN